MKKTYSESYRKDFLDVGEGHKLYFELYGNPEGKKILFLHGGPGAGFDEKHKRFFDPKFFNVIFFDQRGSGKSTPFASVKNNTTDHLVTDINKLLDYLEFEKVTVFGGSWGSTLGLVYSIKNINRVLELVLYSIYLGREEDIKFLYGGGVKNHFFENWKRFISLVPKENRDNPTGYYLEKMTCGDKKTEDKFAYEWSYYESAIMHLKQNPKKIEKDLKKFDPKALSILEAYYAVNKNFLSDDFILKNAKILSGIPVFLIHGRYDFVCLPSGAFGLHEQIKGSCLQVVTSGHASSDPGMNSALIKQMQKLM